MLRAFVATVLAALCLSGLSARSDDIPTLDVNPVCHGIAMQGELEAGLQQTSFQQCVQSEQATRDEIKKQCPQGALIHGILTRGRVGTIQSEANLDRDCVARSRESAFRCVQRCSSQHLWTPFPK